MVKVDLLHTSRPGIRVFFMRWNPSGNIGGFGVQAFGRVLQVYVP